MKFEITHENGEKEVITFNGEKAVVGTADTADIKIKSTYVSRNHLILEKIDSKIYVTDLDNEAGTYINDELLEPNKRIEFLTFFPIQIGPKVYIALLAEEDPNKVTSAKLDLVFSENIKQSTTSSKKEKSSEPISKGIQEKNKKSTPANKAMANASGKPIKGTTNQLIIPMIIASVVAGGFFIKKQDRFEEATKLSIEKGDPQITLNEKKRSELQEVFNQIKSKPKCSESLELFYCQTLKVKFPDSEGFSINNKKMTLFLNFDKVINTVLKDKLLKVPNQIKRDAFIASVIYNPTLIEFALSEKIKSIGFVFLRVIEGNEKVILKYEISYDQIAMGASINDILYSINEAFESGKSENFEKIVLPLLNYEISDI